VSAVDEVRVSAATSSPQDAEINKEVGHDGGHLKPPASTEVARVAPPLDDLAFPPHLDRRKQVTA